MTWHFHCGENLATLVGSQHIQNVSRAIEIALLSDARVTAALESNGCVEYPVYIMAGQHTALLGHISNVRQVIYVSVNRSRRGMFAEFHVQDARIELFSTDQCIKRAHVPECLIAHIRDAQY